MWIEIRSNHNFDTHHFVTPFAGVWIEISDSMLYYILFKTSLPSRECGLKYAVGCRCCSDQWSLPSRECGLKYCRISGTFHPCTVTPFAGVWIEINFSIPPLQGAFVTPFAGVWIEIRRDFRIIGSIKSLPSRECGGICGGRAAGRCR